MNTKNKQFKLFKRDKNDVVLPCIQKEEKININQVIQECAIKSNDILIALSKR